MAEIGSWNGHVFIVSPTLIRGFTGLTIKGSNESDTKTGSSQQYLSRKAGKPVEVAITVELNAMAGCPDVRGEALAFVSDATNGATNYFYVAGQKLVPCQLMLNEANIVEVQIASNGTWVSASVKLAMKQATLNDGSVVSVKKKTVKKPDFGVTKPKRSTKSKSLTGNDTKSAIDTVNKIVDDAKNASKSKVVVKPSGINKRAAVQ